MLALDGVTLSLRGGEVHSFVGENGAGKSTLMKIIAGIHLPTAGRLVYRGRPVVWRRCAEAQEAGIAMIHQELNLVDELTVADNIFLGRERMAGGFVSVKKSRREAAGLLRQLNADVDAGARVGDLSIAQRQLVEIAKALSCDASVLIMDEPTAVLSQRDTAALFAVIRGLRARGVCILYVSHLLSEVLAISDRVTVMRDGRVVTTLDGENLKGVSERDIATLMVGRPMADHFPPRGVCEGSPSFAVQDVSTDLLKDISFDVRRGEIFGLAGLIGSGRTELAETIFGVRTAHTGSVSLDGGLLSIKRPADAIGQGLGYLSEDRKGTGLTLPMSVIENTTLVSLARYSRVLINHRREAAATQGHIDRLQIKVGDAEEAVDHLSGGNQQKVALAKWLETEPRVLIVDEPTRGVDIGAKEEIYRLLKDLAARGTCIIMISSELNELLGMCHRIGVMRAGRLVAVVDGASATEETLMHHAAGVHGEKV